MWDSCLDKCPLECNRTKYLTEISSLQLSGGYYSYLIEENSNLASDFVSQETNANVAAKSFVSLNIFYKTLSFELTEETHKMNIVDLLASIGGNLSLFLGVSIFSLFEIIEILIEIYLIKRKSTVGKVDRLKTLTDW